MPAACCLTLDNVTVIRPALCVERITRLSGERMREVCSALELTTACDDLWYRDPGV
jgi:mRNA-degrading endonuclease toxin of MazEF toxin-antitoxin module